MAPSTELVVDCEVEFPVEEVVHPGAFLRRASSPDLELGVSAEPACFGAPEPLSLIWVADQRAGESKGTKGQAESTLLQQLPR